MSLKKFPIFIKDNHDGMFVVMSVLIMLVILVANLFALSNNLIFSDEGWYLCLMRDLPHSGSAGSKFYLLFNNVFNNNVYVIRITCWLLQIVGGIVLALGFCSFVDLGLRKKKIWVLLLLSFSALYWCSGLQACPSFNYNTLKILFAELGTGFMLLGLSKNSKWFIALSGFSIAFLFPVMITTVIFIPILFFAILFLSRKKKVNGLFFVIGVIMFAALYFLFIETPKETMLGLFSETQNVMDRGGQDYGVIFLVKWIEVSMMYLCKCAVVASLIFGLSHFLGKHVENRNIKNVVLLVASFAILLYAWRYLQPITTLRNGEWFNDLVWILFFMLCWSVLVMKTSLDRKELVMISVLVLATICLSFGSNVPFYRHKEILPFLNLVLLYLVLKKSYKWKLLLSGVVLLSFCLILFGFFGRNWHGDKWFGNHVPVESIGIHQNINLEQGCIDKLVSCREIVPQGKVLNSPENWGQVVLLGYMPLSYDFDVSRNSISKFQQIVDSEMKREGQLWAISHIWQTDFNNKMLSLEGYGMKIDTVNTDVYFHVLINNEIGKTRAE